MQWLWCRDQRRRAVPLKACTATATEITGVRVLTEVLDLVSEEMCKQ